MVLWNEDQLVTGFDVSLSKPLPLCDLLPTGYWKDVDIYFHLADDEQEAREFGAPQ